VLARRVKGIPRDCTKVRDGTDTEPLAPWQSHCEQDHSGAKGHMFLKSFILADDSHGWGGLHVGTRPVPAAARGAVGV